MAEFSDALTGYLSGMNEAARQPTPVQSFLAQLREGQQLALQRQQAQAMLAYHQGILGNAADRNAVAAQHYSDMADIGNRRADIAEARQQAMQNFQTRSLDIKQLLSQAQAGNQTARAKLAAAQAAYTASKKDLVDQFGAAQAQSIIDKNEALASFTGTKDVNAQGPSYGDVLKQYQQDLKSWNMLPLNKRGAMPTLQGSAQKLQGLPIGANATPPSDEPAAPAEKNAMDLATPSAAPAPVAQPNPLLNMLKPAQPVTPDVTTPDSGVGDQAMLRPYSPALQRFVTQHGKPVKAADNDPLHGQFSQRDPGLYSMNGKQYLVDGSGMIQALGDFNG